MSHPLPSPLLADSHERLITTSFANYQATQQMCCKSTINLWIYQVRRTDRQTRENITLLGSCNKKLRNERHREFGHKRKHFRFPWVAYGLNVSVMYTCYMVTCTHVTSSRMREWIYFCSPTRNTFTSQHFPGKQESVPLNLFRCWHMRRFGKSFNSATPLLWNVLIKKQNGSQQTGWLGKRQNLCSIMTTI